MDSSNNSSVNEIAKYLVFLAILFIICAIIYKYYVKKEPYVVKFKKNSNIGGDVIKKKSKSKLKNTNVKIQDPNKFIDKILTSNQTLPTVNPYFVEMQFNNDYRDTLNAFNTIVPCQKQLFNRADVPVKTSVPPLLEVKNLIVSFIDEINATAENEPKTLNALTGWFNDMPEKKEETGWDKSQKELGLPSSIYADPAKYAPVNLIKIDHLEKSETENETKYVIYLIIQKTNVKDQMVVRVSFVIDREDLNLEREFFDSENNNYETTVKIEEIFIVGFMTQHSSGSKSSLQNFYNFEGMNENGFINDEIIMKELNKKRRQYLDEKPQC